MYLRLLACSLATMLLVACGGDPSAERQRFFESGNAFFAEGNYQEAILQYRNALQIDNRFGRARYQLGLAYREVGDRQRALAEIVRAADLLPEDIEVQLEAARVLIAAGRFEDAKARAEGALKLDPKNADAHVLRGTSAANLRDFEAALEAFESGLASNPSRSDLHVNLALFRQYAGSTEEAEASLTQALRLDPTSIEARTALANLYWSQGRVDEVERILKEAVQVAPEDETANRMLGMFYLATGRPELAEAPLRQAAAGEDASRTRLVLADYLVTTSRLDEGAAILRELATVPDTLAPATIRLVTIERQAGRSEQGYAMLAEALDKAPSNALLHMARARFLLLDGRVDEAAQSAQAALEIAPESWEARELNGSVLLAKRQHDEATAEFTEALRLNPSAIDAQLGLARVNLAQGRHEAAIRFAREALQVNPGSDLARFVLVQGLLATGDVSRARVEIEPLERLEENAQVHALRGQIEARAGNRAAAAKAFERALALDPGSKEAVAGLVGLELSGDNASRAVEHASGYVKAAPNDAQGHLLTARAYIATGQVSEAESSVLKAIELDPTLRPAYDLLANLYRRQGKYAEARATFEQAVRQRPNDWPALTMIGILFEAEGRRAEAKDAYERALSASSSAALAANNLAYMHAEEGANLDRALNLAQTAKAALPDDPDVNDTLGWVYYKRDLPQLAIPPLEQSVRANPRHPLYRYHLGLAYLKAGQTDKGREELMEAFKLDPSLRSTEEARRALGPASSR